MYIQNLTIRFTQPGTCIASAYVQDKGWRKYAAGGVGYCKVSTVIAKWFNDILTQDEIKLAYMTNQYGASVNNDSYYIAGGVGVCSMLKIAEYLGYVLHSVHSDDAGCVGYVLIKLNEVAK